MRDIGFKVSEKYKHAFSLLAATLGKKQVDVMKEAVHMLVVAYGMAEKFPDLVEAASSPRKECRDELLLSVLLDLAAAHLVPIEDDTTRAQKKLRKGKSKRKNKRKKK